MSDLISRHEAIDAINTWDKFGVDERNRVVRWYEGLEPYVHLRDVVTAIVNLPSAEPEPSIARDIATIIEDEMDMRVILRNAELTPCDVCVYNEDCEEMRIYCPARGRSTDEN